MKSYSDRKRSFFQALNSFGQFSKHAANPELIQFVKENPKTIRQKVSMSFNEPAEAKAGFNAGFWVGGDRYWNNLKTAQDFRAQQFGDKVFHEDGEKILYFNLKCSTSASDDAFAKVQEAMNAFRTTRDFKRANEREGIDFNVTKNGEEIFIQVIGVAPERSIRRKCP
jgi:hypothetical protein